MPHFKGVHLQIFTAQSINPKRNWEINFPLLQAELVIVQYWFAGFYFSTFQEYAACC
jgi:hypothetical protein